MLEQGGELWGIPATMANPSEGFIQGEGVGNQGLAWACRTVTPAKSLPPVRRPFPLERQKGAR